MTPEFVVTLSQDTLFTAAKLAAPVLCVGLLVGLVVAILQAVTSVQEQTLSIIPKMFAVVLTLMLLMPWILSQVLDFTSSIFSRMVEIAH